MHAEPCSCAGGIEFLYNVTDVGARALAQLDVGDGMSIVGPLGRPFHLDPRARRLLLGERLVRQGVYEFQRAVWQA